MSKMSILVALSDSDFQKNLLEAGLSIATGAKCRITALHVIEDSNSSIDDASFEREQKAKAEELIERYGSIFKKYDCQYHLEIAKGDPINLINEHGRHHDLLILGAGNNGSGVNKKEISREQKRSFLESLLKNCPTPALIVKAGNTNWAGAIHIVTDLNFNPIFLRNSICLANLLDIKSEIFYLLEYDMNRSAKEVKRQLELTLPETKNLSVTIVPIDHWKEKGNADLNQQINQNPIIKEDKLLVIPTVFRRDKRTTITGESMSELLTCLQPGQVLFWPEEYEKDAAVGNIEIHQKSLN